MYLGNDLITADLLERELNAILLAEPFKFILIKGDLKAHYGDVRKAMEVCEKVGAKTVALQTDQAELSQADAKKKEG